MVSFEVGGGENVPSIPGALTTRNSAYLVRGQSTEVRFYYWLWHKRRHLRDRKRASRDRGRSLVKRRGFMMTLSKGNISALLSLCAGNSPSPVNSPHKGQWRGALMFSLICFRINDWANNREAGDLRRNRAHYDVIVMLTNIQRNSGDCLELYLSGKQCHRPNSLLGRPKKSTGSTASKWNGDEYGVSRGMFPRASGSTYAREHIDINIHSGTPMERPRKSH